MEAQTPEQAHEDDWLAGAAFESAAENLDVPGMSIPLDIEIPDDDHDGDGPALV